MLLGNDGAFGRQLGAAVVCDLTFNQQIAWSVRFSMHSVKVVVFDCAGKLPFVSLALAMSFAGKVRGPIAVVTSPCNGSRRCKYQSANCHQPDRFAGFHDIPPLKAGYSFSTEREPTERPILSRLMPEWREQSRHRAAFLVRNWCRNSGRACIYSFADRNQRSPFLGKGV